MELVGGEEAPSSLAPSGSGLTERLADCFKWFTWVNRYMRDGGSSLLFN